MKKSKGGKKPLPKKAKPKVVKRPPPKKSNPKQDIVRSASDELFRARIERELKKMNASKQKALLALAAAATAVAAAASALAQDDEATPTEPKPAAAEPKPAAKPKPAKVEPCAAAVTGPNTTTPRKCIKPMPHGAGEHEFPPDVEPKAAPAKPAPVAAVVAGEVPMFDQVVAAFKEYCGIYTRENGIKAMKPFLPEGGKALADIPEDKLPEFLAVLKA